jgi:hypothetical protein
MNIRTLQEGSATSDSPGARGQRRASSSTVNQILTASEINGQWSSCLAHMGRAMVWAPMLKTDTFDQSVHFESSIPSRTVQILEEPDVYSVGFHPEHTRHPYAGHDGKYKIVALENEEVERIQRKHYDWDFGCEDNGNCFATLRDSSMCGYGKAR